MLARRSVLALFPLLLACACGSGSSGSDAATGGSGGTAGSADAGGAGGSAAVDAGGSAGADAGDAGDAGGSGPIVDIVTSMGTMSFRLDPVHMPITTANFLSYVNKGFYAGTIFHRVIPDFMIQGGGFTSGMVEKTTDPSIQLETSPEVLHDYGTISMARTTLPNSATSQFFVVNNPTGAHSLDGKYAAFGHLIAGSKVLDAISQVPTQSVSTDAGASYNDVPVTDVTIVSATER